MLALRHQGMQVFDRLQLDLERLAGGLFVQPSLFDRFFSHKTQQPRLARPGEENGQRRLAITPGPASLLHVILNRSRLLPVDNEAHIRHVKPQAKGVGANDGRQRGRGRLLLPQEARQQALTFLHAAHARMVKRQLEAQALQPSLDGLADLERRHKNHGPAARHLAQEIGRQAQAGLVLQQRQAHEADVGAIYAGYDDAGLGHAQRIEDAALRFGADLSGRSEALLSSFEANAVDGKLVLRRFSILPDEPVIVAEDVVTRGGRVQETVDIVRSQGGRVLAIVTLVDRSAGTAKFDGIPHYSLLQMAPVTWEPSACPHCKRGSKAIHPGS